MPTENHIIIDKGTSLHPETNTGQVYDYANAKWLDETIEELQSKHSNWNEVEGKPTSFPPSPHTHTVSEITDFPDPYELPTASSTVLGGIKPDGTTITVNPVTGIASSYSSLPSEWFVLETSAGWSVRTPPLRVRKEGDLFRIYGSVQNSLQSSSLAFTLPQGFRPESQIQALVSTGGEIGYATILPNGNVFITNTADSLVFINITFF